MQDAEPDVVWFASELALRDGLALSPAELVRFLARNDDYGYLKSSRIIWTCPTTGTYYARVRQVDPNVAGADTHYDLGLASFDNRGDTTASTTRPAARPIASSSCIPAKAARWRRMSSRSTRHRSSSAPARP